MESGFVYENPAAPHKLYKYAFLANVRRQARVARATQYLSESFSADHGEELRHKL